MDTLNIQRDSNEEMLCSHTDKCCNKYQLSDQTVKVNRYDLMDNNNN